MHGPILIDKEGPQDWMCLNHHHDLLLIRQKVQHNSIVTHELFKYLILKCFRRSIILRSNLALSDDLASI